MTNLKLSANERAKIAEQVTRYREAWESHLKEMSVVKFNLSTQGQLDFDEAVEVLRQLVLNAGEGYHAYLIAKAAREVAS